MTVAIKNAAMDICVYKNLFLVFCDVLQTLPKPSFFFLGNEYSVCFDEKLYVKVFFLIFFNFLVFGSIKTK